MKKIIFLLLLLTFPFSLFPSPVIAESVNLSINPPVTEILLAPGKKISQVFTLQTSGLSLAVTPEIHLAKPSDSHGHMTIDPNPLNPNSLPLTITISGPPDNPTLTFEAASSDVSQDVYLALVFRSVGENSYSPTNSTQISPAISALILVTITPDGLIPTNLAIRDFTLPPLHDSWLPLTPTPSLVNSSSIMIRPEGQYKIISPTGKTVFSLSLYPNLILGNSSRTITPPLSWSPKWYDLGPYRLHLTITSLGDTKITEETKTIWILPLRLLLVLFILAITFYYFTTHQKISIL